MVLPETLSFIRENHGAQHWILLSRHGAPWAQEVFQTTVRSIWTPRTVAALGK